MTSSGGFLAGRLAMRLRDNEAAAAFYAQALKADPNNLDLLDRTFLSLVSDGQMDQAMRYAEKLIAADPRHRIARLSLGVRALRSKQYNAARAHFTHAGRGPILDLLAPLLGSWASAAAGDIERGLAEAGRVRGEEWYQSFRDFSAGLIYDLAGQHDKAIARLQASLARDSSPARVAEALIRTQSRAGQREEALKSLETYEARFPSHPVFQALKFELKESRALESTVRSHQAGAADILLGLAGPLSRQGGADFALVFYRLALYLDPTNAPALIGMAEIYSGLKQPAHAVEALKSVPDASPFKRAAEIQLGDALDELDRTNEAVAHLEKLIKQDPKNLDAVVALGNLYHGRKRFEDSAKTFSLAVDLLDKPARANWTVFYLRGIAYERTKQWPLADADFRKALELFPDQPLVLNYLGYSLIDRGMKYEEGISMIRKAVAQRPEDGYFIDSLGWAHYKLNQYDDAVRQLERAVELRPGDPTINDHLGDAYWRVGRKLEAIFQWNHAKDNKPEPEDLAIINEKLKSGLKDDQSANGQKPGNGG